MGSPAISNKGFRGKREEDSLAGIRTENTGLAAIKALDLAATQSLHPPTSQECHPELGKQFCRVYTPNQILSFCVLKALCKSGTPKFQVVWGPS
jgi:hypothetical protein